MAQTCGARPGWRLTVTGEAREGYRQIVEQRSTERAARACPAPRPSGTRIRRAGSAGPGLLGWLPFRPLWASFRCCAGRGLRGGCVWGALLVVVFGCLRQYGNRHFAMSTFDTSIASTPTVLANGAASGRATAPCYLRTVSPNPLLTRFDIRVRPPWYRWSTIFGTASKHAWYRNSKGLELRYQLGLPAIVEKAGLSLNTVKSLRKSSASLQISHIFRIIVALSSYHVRNKFTDMIAGLLC